MSRRIAVTGGPGAGKTTLLLALQARGFAIVGDSARSIIRDRMRRGLSPRPDPLEFAQQVLRMDAANHAAHATTPGLVFFDRCVLDALGMLHEVRPLGESELEAWRVRCPYSPTAFVLPPWEAIYVNDSERDHSFQHAEAVHASVQAWYRRCGCTPVEVPQASVADRCAYVLQVLAEASPGKPMS